MEGGEQEGLLLRANTAAVREGQLQVTSSVSTGQSLATKQESQDNKEGVKTEVTSLPPGAVIITTHPHHTTEQVLVHAPSHMKEENAEEQTWEEQQQQQQQQPHTYHWSQLVPLITTPARTSAASQQQQHHHIQQQQQNQLQQPKNEIETKPTTNGDVLINGKGHPGSVNEGTGGGSHSRRESCSQDPDLDLSADDDDVFVSDMDISANTDKRRTQSLGSFSGKEEPKSPRKVRKYF